MKPSRSEPRRPLAAFTFCWMKSKKSRNGKRSSIPCASILIAIFTSPAPTRGCCQVNWQHCLRGAMSRSMYTRWTSRNTWTSREKIRQSKDMMRSRTLRILFAAAVCRDCIRWNGKKLRWCSTWRISITPSYWKTWYKDTKFGILPCSKVSRSIWWTTSAIPSLPKQFRIF